MISVANKEMDRRDTELKAWILKPETNKIILKIKRPSGIDMVIIY